MDFMGLILTIVIYVILFFIIDVATIKKDAPFRLRFMYAFGFFSLIVVVNLLSATSVEPPFIGITIFQISFCFILCGSYVLWHYLKNKDNK